MKRDERYIYFNAKLDDDDMPCLLGMVNDDIFNLSTTLYILKSYLED